MKQQETLSRFLAQDRRQAILDGQALPDRSEGTLLFADISGFTTLTETLGNRLGTREGAEAVTKILEVVYGALCNEIWRRRGSVILFSGDALTCWFEGDKGVRAITSALGCQEAMIALAKQTSPADIPVSLAIKVAAVRGPIRRLVVGDPEIQLLDIVGGKTVERLTEAADLTHSGEVLVDRACLSSVLEEVNVLERREGPCSAESFAVIAGLAGRVGSSLLMEGAGSGEEPASLTLEQTRPWILRPVFERICSGHGEYLAELRIASLLFLDFTGIELDRDSEAANKLSQFVVWVQQTVGRFGGFVLSLSLDKGTYLFCVFGVPVAHDDDAFRAAAAARALLEAPAKCDSVTGVRMGLARGRINCGIFGGSQRGSYNVQGTDANIAARLMTRAAPGQILVSGRVASELGGKFVTRDLGEFELKGFDRKVPVLELGRQLERPAARGGRAALLSALRGRTEHAQTEMIGRRRELELFRDALSALVQGGPSVAYVVEGEAGIGKSLCINSLLREADAMGVPSVLAAGDAIDSGTLYHAYRPAFAQLFGLEELPQDEQRRQAHVLDLLSEDEETQRLVPLLGTVLPFTFPENEHTRDMSGQVRADNTRRILCSLLPRLAGTCERLDGVPGSGSSDKYRPLILVIEDAHWLDSASWALTLEIRQRIPRLMVLVATRPIDEPLPLAYKELREEPGVQVLRLDSLDTEETLELVKSRLGVDSLPAAVCELIIARAEGHPFFSEEIAYALRDSGQIQICGRECRLTAEMGTSTSLMVPDTVEGTITSRMDALSSTQQLLLKVGSVIGRVFQMRVLRDVYPVDAEWEQIPRDLEVLSRLDLTPVETPVPELSYIFKHVITQQVAYGLMVSEQRKSLHSAVAQWFERRPEADLARYFTILAHHWERAAVPEKALHYLDAAAEQALRNFANRETIDLVLRALALSEDIPDGRAGLDAGRRALWHRYLADSHLGLGHNAQSRRQFELALSLQGNPMPTGALRLAGSFIWQIFNQLLLRVLPEGTLRVAEQRRKAELERANTWERYAQVVYFDNERAKTIYASLRAANCAERAGPSPELSRAYANLCITLGMARLPWLSGLYDRMAHQVAERVGNIQALGWAQELSGAANVGFARHEKARRETDLALENYHRLGDWRHWEEAVWVQFATTLAQGDFPRAMYLARALERSAHRRRDAQSQIIGLCGQAEVLLQSGVERAFAVALARVRSAMELVDENVTVIERIRIFSDLALALLRTGDYRGCLSSLGSWLKLCRESQPVASYVMEAYGSSAWAALELLELPADRLPAPREELVAVASSAVRWLGFYAFVFKLARPRHQVARAILMRSTGQGRRVLRPLRHALALAQSQGQPYDELLAHRELATFLGPDAPQFPEHRAQEAAIAARLACPVELLEAPIQAAL